MYDPEKVSYKTLLEFFYKMHDPTTANRQGPDVGSQYRSAIFYHNPQQEKEAKEITEQVNKQWWKGQVATQVLPAAEWYDAETYHQLYLDKSTHNLNILSWTYTNIATDPSGYECPSHFLRKFPALQ